MGFKVKRPVDPDKLQALIKKTGLSHSEISRQLGIEYTKVRNFAQGKEWASHWDSATMDVAKTICRREPQ